MIPVQNKPTVDMSTQTKSFDELVKEHMKEKLPEEAYDPVSFELLTEPMIAWCGHSFNRNTILKIAKITKDIPIKTVKEINCPLCKRKIHLENLYSEMAFGKLISTLNKK